MKFFAELKRRNVYQVAVAYAVVAWLLVQVATQVFPFFDVPNWAVRLVVLLSVLGFPVALVCSWAFELTPEGIKREGEIDPNLSFSRKTGRKLTALIVVVAVVAGGLMVFPIVRSPEGSGAGKQSAIAIESKSIAVRPFEHLNE